MSTSTTTEAPPRPAGKAIRRTAEARAALAAMDDAALADGRAYWLANATGDRRWLIDAKPETPEVTEGTATARITLGPRRSIWKFLGDQRLFQRIATGAKLTVQAVRKAIEAVIAKAEGEAKKLGAKLRAATIDIPTWQTRMEALVKRAHAAVGTIGGGGKDAISLAEKAAIAARVRDQFAWLENFAVEVEEGLPLDGLIPPRCAQYLTAGIGTFEASRRVGDLAAGFAWERRYLNSETPCDPCAGYAAQGWQPAGTLPDIGEDCDCHSLCKCSYGQRSHTDPRPVAKATSKEIYSMAVLKLDADKCRRRNRLTALRGRHAAPVRFLLAPPPLATATDAPPSTSARGTLPADDDEAMARINAILGRTDADPLGRDEVYLIYPEVGNTNYVSDRFMFLGRKTLRGIAASAADGFAFMNSHRTGSLSTPTELPYGRTFAGRFEMTRDEEGKVAARTIVGAYMLAGLSPNGTSGPTTDDLYAGIAAGTIFDVSLGLYGGYSVCDVCGEDLMARDPEAGFLCPHVPGTHRKMTEDQIEAQKVRGVADGVASYTLEDAHAAEFSAVFDGAVPGAGFKKTVALARSGRLSRQSLAEANHAYRSLIMSGAPRAGHTLSRSRLEGPTVGFTLSDLFGRIRVTPEEAASLGVTDLDDDLDDHQEMPPSRQAKVSPGETLSPELKQLRAELAAERQARADEKAARENERRAEDATRIKTEAKTFAVKAVGDRKSMPFGVDDLTTLHAFVHLSAAGLPTEGFDPVPALDRFVAAIPPHNLTAEAIGRDALPPNLAVVYPDLAADKDGRTDPDAWARAANDAFFAQQGVKRIGS